MGTDTNISASTPVERHDVRTCATRDHDEIRRWAVAHGAEPATGEATASGPATVHVTDGGVGIRFNFPGAAVFRPISWAEWFEYFDRLRLVFVYEERNTAEIAKRAYARWESRAGEMGRDWDDWFRAEQDLRDEAGGIPPLRYRFARERGSEGA
jgi:hypothetical protein